MKKNNTNKGSEAGNKNKYRIYLDKALIGESKSYTMEMPSAPNKKDKKL